MWSVTAKGDRLREPSSHGGAVALVLSDVCGVMLLCPCSRAHRLDLLP